ncbi:MAG: nitrile hydratase subunit beta [Streptosporangiales bacterium]|nr:nitrile hydratase subunit beta [Streptosporangiales bacterium]
MVRPHDVGGAEGYGRVHPSPDEPPFEHVWEARVHAVHQQLVAAGVYSRDEGRDGIERLTATEYALGYYERRFLATVRLLQERGILGEDELAELILRDQP